MRKGLNSAIGVLLGFLAVIWILVPVSTWKGFMVFAGTTILILILAIVKGHFLEDDSDPEATKN